MKQKILDNKIDIDAWLQYYRIENYVIHDNLTVDVNGNINLSNKQLAFIPVKFSAVSGHFWCHNNQLTTLEFCPTNVGGHFDCCFNFLNSLEFCPEIVGGSFYCRDNQITSLEYCPQKVKYYFYCSNNEQLGSFQNIHNFKEIYEEHLKIKKIKEEKYLLSDNLISGNNINSPIPPFKI